MNYTPDLRQKLSIVLNNFRVFGLRQTILHALAYLCSRSRDTFDERHGVSTVLTGGSVGPLEPGVGDPISRDSGHGYEPTDERVMRHILRELVSRFDISRFTFVDLGCGKGRAVLMASELPFERVIGVEISPAHCEAARQNIASYRRSPARRLGNGKVSVDQSASVAPSVVCADVTRYEFPRSDLIVYLFNPFRGAVFRTTMDRLAAFQVAEQRRVYVVLMNPAIEDLLLENPAFTKCHEVQVITAGHSWNLWQCHTRRAMPGTGVCVESQPCVVAV